MLATMVLISESDSDSSVEIIEPIETHDKNGCVVVSNEAK